MTTDWPGPGPTTHESLDADINSADPSSSGEAPHILMSQIQLYRFNTNARSMDTEASLSMTSLHTEDEGGTPFRFHFIRPHRLISPM